ncbi:hypothetical protein BN2475_420033 [Paraburkholderia ribeironis]|uniref:Uncharacterized protein n=1 Tax=Paraburkholderia ribeironis TaxID=1247936 RepID=A0A1N7S7K4_9BURK|nr:hypothetical protein BN2475_420033 [Paraburkholderia ribeironis]
MSTPHVVLVRKAYFSFSNAQLDYKTKRRLERWQVAMERPERMKTSKQGERKCGKSGI